MKQYIIIALMCIVGLSLIYVLLPRDKELALMHMKDKDYEVALQGLEQTRQLDNKLDTATVGTLAQLYLQNGEVNKAIEVLESYLKDHPDDVHARIRLGQYYQYAQRPEDYLRNLETLSKLDAQKTYLQELSRIYNYNSEYQKQIEVLAKLADGGKEAEPQLLQLVQLLASMEQKADALAYMKLYQTRYPQSMGRDQTQLLFSLLVDQGEKDAAVALAQAWAAKAEDVSALAYYAAAVSSMGKTDVAIEMLRPHLVRSDEHPEILIAFINLHRATARNAEAYKVLGEYYQAGNLPEELIPTYLELAVAFGHEDVVMEVAEKVQMERVNQALLLNMVDLSFNPKHEALRKLLQAKLGADYLKLHPVLKAGLSLSAGDSKTAATVYSGLNVAELEPFERAYLAVFMARGGLTSQALAVLKTLDSADPANDSLMPRLANAYVLAGAAKEGMVFADTIKKDREEKKTITTPVTVGWLLLAAANGREQEVFAVLDQTQEQIGNRMLLDLYYVAGQANQSKLQLAVAERYRSLYPEDEIGLVNLMQAYIRAGQAEKTIALLEEKHSPEELAKNDVYYSALYKVVKAGSKTPGYAHARERYYAILTTRVKDGSLPEEDRTAAVNALLEVGAYDVALPLVKEMAFKDPNRYGPLYINHALKAKRTQDAVAFVEYALKSGKVSQNDKTAYVSLLTKHGDPAKALPYLESLALNQGGNWLFAYEDTLKKRGIKKDLVPLWKARAAKTTDEKEMRILAYKLADAGETNEAAQLFYTLAKKSGTSSPEGKDTRQLVYLWGEKPTTEGVDWLTANAEATSGKVRAGWFKHLMAVRRGDRIVEVMEGKDLSAESSDVVESYITALQQQKNKKRLEPVLREQMAHEQDPERLAFYANTALSAGLLKVARQGFEKVLNTKAYAPYMLKELGNIAFFEGDMDTAKDYYNRYLKETSDEAGQGDYVDPDHLVHLRLGIIYLRNQEEALAKKHLVRCLELIETAQDKDRNILLAEAKARYLLGRDSEALEIYQFLLDQSPDDYEVAGDYAEVLIKQQKYAEAERILNGLPSLPDGQEPVELLGNYEQGGSAVGSQRLRIELLRAEIMLGRGEINQALAKYKALEAEYPENPYPLIGQASINNYMGFPHNALAKLDKAVQVQPENKDIARVRKRIHDTQRTQLTAGVEWRDTEDAESGFMTTVKGHKLLKNYDKIGFVYDHFFYDMDNGITMNGVQQDVSDNAWLAEVFYHHVLQNGHRAEFSVLGSKSGAGATAAYVLPGFRGPFKIFGEYHRPYWTLGQGIVVDAARDRVGVYQDVRWDNYIFGGIGASGNRYTVDGDEEVANSFGVNALLGYRLPKFTKPELRVIYGFDGEYLTDEAETITANGLTFKPLPLNSREIHSLALNLRDDTSSDVFWWELYGGYAYDRLGGHGPFAGGELNYLLNDMVLSTLRASSSLSSNATGDRVNRIGGYVTLRF